MTDEELNKDDIRKIIKSSRHEEELICKIIKLCRKQYIKGLEQGHFDKLNDILELQSENKLLKNKVKRWKKRAHKSSFHYDQLSCKNRNLITKLNNYKTIIDEISKWLQEQYSCYSHLETISLSTNCYLIYQEVLEQFNRLKENNNA